MEKLTSGEMSVWKGRYDLINPKLGYLQDGDTEGAVFWLNTNGNGFYDGEYLWVR